MRRDGRAYLALCLHALATLTGGVEHGIPIEIQLWDTGRTPLAHMVDVTNEFGLKVLAEHNFLNDNNIAFSPYGLTGIMVALYEGIDGESSYQIQRGMQMPWNRNVMRVGFRDIHRTLKTYFVPEEGFLAGLALNNENVTFTNEYKKILRFYGFDLDRDQLPTLLPQSNNTESNVTMTVPPSTPVDSTTVTMPVLPAREDTTTTTTESPKEETTLNPNAETLTEIDVRGPTTTVTTSVANAEIATGSDVTTLSTDPITNTAPTVTDPSPPETSTTRSPTTGTETAGTTETTMTTAQETTANEVETSGTLETTATSAAISTVETTVTTNEGSTETGNTATTETPPTEQMTTEITTVETTTVANDTSLETLQRKKKSVADFVFTNSPPYVDDYLIYRAYEIPAELPRPTGGDNMFLVNGLRNVQVTYMHYDTILEHAYLPHLEASALRLPLDSDRYYLLVVLPSHGGPAELGRLIARMARESDLRDVHAALRPRRVKAVVPSFTVKGHITLTTDLQKLGIRDVFEPRQRDFTPMTPQPGVYVRSIEQAVSVAIRKYSPDDKKRNRYVTNHQPVPFGATYPFVYFVMDASIHVSLMAGKMVDPLNTRIL